MQKHSPLFGVFSIDGMFHEKIDLYWGFVKNRHYKRLTVKESLVFARVFVIAFIKDIAKSFLFLFRPKRIVPDFASKKIVFANTSNNYEALKFLLSKYPDAILVSSGGFVLRQKKPISVKPFLYSYSFFTKYLFLVYIALHPRYRVHYYLHILKTYGYIDCFRRMFKNNSPECIFISNDHVPDSRALILAARKEGLRCIYLQHASVSNLFPPMRTSHALLYGEYSEQIYKEKATDSIFYNVGNQKFDHYKNAIVNKQRSGIIGVAYNRLDKIADVMSLCDQLLKDLPGTSIILRPHPAEKRRSHGHFPVSDPTSESSLEFLKKIDILIAGNSSILLEAASMNVVALQFGFSTVPEHFIDYYGFIKTGVAREIKDRTSLINTINGILQSVPTDVRRFTSVYDASVGAPYEFAVEEHITNVIDEILNS